MFRQTIRDVESMYKDIGGYDKSCYEFKDMCREAWSERFNYLCIFMSKNKMKVNLVFSMKPKRHTLNALLKRNLFD